MRVLAALLTLIAAPALARAPILTLPLDCTLGESCYIQNYVDADPGPGAADFTCHDLSYDGHKGTDFALPSQAHLDLGVTVTPTAPGTVLATRDGEVDISQAEDAAPDVSGKECGNGVVIDHGDGWTSQYCHMKNGSIAVRKGQRVSTTTPLGLVGLSGQTEFPHLHFVLRNAGKVVDPFNPSGVISCDTATPRDTLWSSPMTYEPGGLLSLGISTDVPSYDAVKAGTAAVDALTTTSPALVAFGFAYGGREGDILRLSIAGPAGEVVSHDAQLTKPQAQFFRAAGKRSPGTWPPGGYRASATLIRDGEIIDQMTRDIQITE